MFARLALALSLSLLPAAALAADPPASVAALHADPIAGFQGEWVSRFCSKAHRWKVEGREVKMLQRDPSKRPGDYDNRHAEGAVIFIIREEFDRSDRGIRMRAAFVDPNTGRLSEGQFLALTSYGDDKHTYFSVNEMIRPSERARQCGGSEGAAPASRPSASPQRERLPAQPPARAGAPSTTAAPGPSAAPSATSRGEGLDEAERLNAEIARRDAAIAARNAATAEADRQAKAAYQAAIVAQKAEAERRDREYRAQLDAWRQSVADTAAGKCKTPNGQLTTCP